MVPTEFVWVASFGCSPSSLLLSAAANPAPPRFPRPRSTHSHRFHPIKVHSGTLTEGPQHFPRGRGNYKSRQLSSKARPSPPPPEPTPRTLREMPGPGKRTKPADGGRERQGSRRTREKKGLQRVQKALSGPSSTPPRAATARREHRGLDPAPPGNSRKVSARSLRWLLPDRPQPLPQRTPHTLSSTLAQTSGSGTAAASLCKSDAETPLTSCFPEAPGAGCFRSAGPRRRREAKPRVAVEMCSTWGRGSPTTMTALSLGLAWCLFPRVAQRSVFRLKDKLKKETILPLR